MSFFVFFSAKQSEKLDSLMQLFFYGKSAIFKKNMYLCNQISVSCGETNGARLHFVLQSGFGYSR